MSKYFILYNNPIAGRNVFQTDIDADSIEVARTSFDKTYNAVIVAIQKGRKFGPRAINKYKLQLSK